MARQHQQSLDAGKTRGLQLKLENLAGMAGEGVASLRRGGVGPRGVAAEPVYGEEGDGDGLVAGT